MYGNSVEQPRWRRRPGSVQYPRFIQCGFLVQVGEYLVDDHGIFSALASCVALPPASVQSDTGDNPDSTATLGAGFYVSIEHPLQTLSPGYCHGWHVCRFCRSKNQSSLTAALPVMGIALPRQYFVDGAWVKSLLVEASSMILARPMAVSAGLA